MATVSLNDINKIYPNGAHAVRGVDMDIADGEFIVFVGPSGCGKSTLLRMIAGLETISEGEMSIDGRSINDVSPAERDVAMVFQNYALYPHMSVRGNMSYGLKNRGMAKAEIDAQVVKTAELLRIDDFLDRQPHQLSGGQRQRVAMGRAIVRSPKVFLFDEPLSNLDAKLRVQMRIEIKRLQRRLGVTTVYVTHDQTEAMTLADRLAVINDGQVEQMGAPMELYHNPKSLFVATFIGSPQMNLLPARFDGKKLNCGKIGVSGFSDLPEDVDLVLGIRPDNLSIEPKGNLSMNVELVEQHGADNLIYGKLSDIENQSDGSDFCVKTSHEMHPENDTTLNLEFDPKDAYIFLKDDGKRVN